jgi:hypothetical protein
LSEIGSSFETLSSRYDNYKAKSADKKDTANAGQQNPIEETISHRFQAESEHVDTEDNQNPSQNHGKPSFLARTVRFLLRRRKLGAGTTWAERTTVFLTLGILIAAGIQAYIYWQQWQVMQAQVEQTERSVILGMGQLATASRNAKTAEDNLKSSQQSSEIDQRPYVITDGVPYFSADDKGQINFSKASIRLKNVGRTPALDTFSAERFDRRYFSGKKTMEALKVSEDSVFDSVFHSMRLYDTRPADREAIEKFVIHQDVAPGANNYFTTVDLTSPFLESDRVDIQNGTTILVFAGIARYKGSNHAYETHFCFFYFGNNPTVWHYCTHHNDIQ